MPNKKKHRRKTSLAKKTTQKRKLAQKKVRPKRTSVVRKTVPLPPEGSQKGRDRQSGDLQGLSNRPLASSESVEELLEEGNALEAEAVQGVEDTPDADQGDVRTREVPEDDVPEEYLDEDR